MSMLTGGVKVTPAVQEDTERNQDGEAASWVMTAVAKQQELMWQQSLNTIDICRQAAVG